MSCDVAALAASLWLASTGPMAAPAATSPATPQASVTPPSVASEPLFTDIAHRAAKLKAATAAYEKGPLDAAFDQMGGASDFETAVSQLSDLDMQGHVTLANRG